MDSREEVQGKERRTVSRDDATGSMNEKIRNDASSNDDGSSDVQTEGSSVHNDCEYMGNGPIETYDMSKEETTAFDDAIKMYSETCVAPESAWKSGVTELKNNGGLHESQHVHECRHRE